MTGSMCATHAAELADLRYRYDQIAAALMQVTDTESPVAARLLTQLERLAEQIVARELAVPPMREVEVAAPESAAPAPEPAPAAAAETDDVADPEADAAQAPPQAGAPEPLPAREPIPPSTPGEVAHASGSPLLVEVECIPLSERVYVDADDGWRARMEESAERLDELCAAVAKQSERIDHILRACADHNHGLARVLRRLTEADRVRHHAAVSARTHASAEKTDAPAPPLATALTPLIEWIAAQRAKESDDL